VIVALLAENAALRGQGHPSVGPLVADRDLELTAQDCVLMPQHQQFGLPGGVSAQQDSRYRQHCASNAVQQRHHHLDSISATTGNRRHPCSPAAMILRAPQAAAAGDWNEAGVWQLLHELLLSELRAADLLDFSRAAVGSSHIRAMRGGPTTGPSPVERGKAGSKHHLIVEAHGIPLAAITTGGNRNDVTQLIPLIQAIPPIRGKRGQPLRRPRYLYADRGYDHEVYRDKVRRFQITPHIARRGTGHGSGLGVYRWVVEGAIALLHWFRRLRIRWEIRDDIHHAFVTLGCAAICWRRLRTALCRE
jgi:hypothetical protein